MHPTSRLSIRPKYSEAVIWGNIPKCSSCPPSLTEAWRCPESLVAPGRLTIGPRPSNPSRTRDMTGAAIIIGATHHPNHNPCFAPVIHPTLQTGVVAMVVAALAWLAA